LRQNVVMMVNLEAGANRDTVLRTLQEVGTAASNLRNPVGCQNMAQRA
jgi:hypothetical protein